MYILCCRVVNAYINLWANAPQSTVPSGGGGGGGANRHGDSYLGDIFHRNRAMVTTPCMSSHNITFRFTVSKITFISKQISTNTVLSVVYIVFKP